MLYEISISGQEYESPSSECPRHVLQWFSSKVKMQVALTLLYLYSTLESCGCTICVRDLSVSLGVHVSKFGHQLPHLWLLLCSNPSGLVKMSYLEGRKLQGPWSMGLRCISGILPTSTISTYTQSCGRALCIGTNSGRRQNAGNTP